MAMKNSPRAIVIHCTAYSYKLAPNQLMLCDGWHKDRDFPKSSLGWYVGYHRIITGDQNYQTRLDDEEGAHCNQVVDGLSMNFQSLGVCVAFNGDVEDMLPYQYALLKAQVQEWQDKYNIPDSKVFFHRYFAINKTCPGTRITDAWLKAMLIRTSPISAPVPSSPMPQQSCIEENIALKEQLSWGQKLIKLLLNK